MCHGTGVLPQSEVDRIQREVFSVFCNFEQYRSAPGFIRDTNAWERSIGWGNLTFVIFSCLATVRDKEELVLDFWRTMFFDGGAKEASSNVKRTIRLVEAIQRIKGTTVTVIPILVDTEPRRTWGWSTPQEELTMACQLMIDDAIDSKQLPGNWKPRLWSGIERDAHASMEHPTTFERCLEMVGQSGERKARITEQEKHLKHFADTYHFPLGLRETAIRQVAAYTLEGALLPRAFHNPILLQSEWPWVEKDKLYQSAFNSHDPLAILHPFPH